MAGAVPAKTANVTAPQIRFFIASPFQLCSFKVTARNKRIDTKLEVSSPGAQSHRGDCNLTGPHAHPRFGPSAVKPLVTTEPLSNPAINPSPCESRGNW